MYIFPVAAGRDSITRFTSVDRSFILLYFSKRLNLIGRSIYSIHIVTTNTADIHSPI